eukprot:1159653-Pelagomonas_calceolata.AAC.4
MSGSVRVWCMVWFGSSQEKGWAMPSASAMHAAIIMLDDCSNLYAECTQQCMQQGMQQRMQQCTQQYCAEDANMVHKDLKLQG